MFGRNTLKNSMAWVWERNVPAERPRLVGEVSAKFANGKCHVVTVTDLYSCILGFVDRRIYLFLQLAPELYSRDWVGPVSDPLLLRKSGSAGNRSRTSGSVTRNSDQYITDMDVAFQVPYVYDYITKLRRKQAETIQKSLKWNCTQYWTRRNLTQKI
jgi:hypothetical protein